MEESWRAAEARNVALRNELAGLRSALSGECGAESDADSDRLGVEELRRVMSADRRMRAREVKERDREIERLRGENVELLRLREERRAATGREDGEVLRIRRDVSADRRSSWKPQGRGRTSSWRSGATCPRTAGRTGGGSRSKRQSS